ncbi:MAG: terpene cyclase/mutase family protein [Phycisphaerales bacterium]|nr:terpene cyclase/mutase family protein [Phycisphaerales bacterium]MCI0630236.1 terpene cyclase/mutase family protein [Phycisphaerales bacterium]MCI0676088.1 terpene cyclase/mutase family protein [Phycisphaerales bacterium]
MVPRLQIALILRWTACAGLALLITLDISPLATSAQDPEVRKAIPDNDNSALISEGVGHILAAQEGENRAEWPYEGVYRVGGQIPIGYRIGGTAICAMALVQAPDYQKDEARLLAVERAVKFIVEASRDPLMGPEYDGGYDVRGWGYTYGLTFLLRARSLEAIPAALSDQVEVAIKFFIDAIQKTEISEVGGWNYARGKGRDAVSPPSPFMTAPTLQAMFEAKAAGFEVDGDVVKRALDALERSRTPTGSFRYSGIDGDKSRESVPGSIGRMAASETTLFLAGRSSQANIRSAVDAFIVHWSWLDKRRAQEGTHAAPYGIAPYYFYYAHYYAAQAVELLPEHERQEYRRRIRELLMSVRLPGGTWNDRVFERSSNYGTAMALMALTMPQTPRPAEWKE